MGGEWTHLISSKQPVFALKTYASLQPRRKNLTPGGVSRRFFCVKILWPSNMSKKWWVKTKTMCNKLNKPVKIQDISCIVGEWLFIDKQTSNIPLRAPNIFRLQVTVHDTPSMQVLDALGALAWCWDQKWKAYALCLTEAVLQNSKMIIYNQWTKHRICVYIQL